jgi:non-ribosomal peptide synthetase-like protein
VIETGPVTLGRDVFIGEHTVVDIHAALGDGAQIGHASALLPGQAVPAGECWHGSPAVPAEADCDYRTVAPARCGALRRTWHSLTRLVLLLAVVGPVSAAVASLLVSRPSLAGRGLARLHIGMIDLGTRLRFGRFDPGRLDLGRATLGRVEITNWIFYVEVLAVAGIVFLAVILAGLIFVGTVPRLLSPLLRPGRVYPLYGLHHGLQRFISRSTNVAFFNNLFGDTSAVVRYLGFIGYRLKPVDQTGSNFGMEVRHEVPRLSVVGTGTMVSDGLTMVNAEFSSTSFRVMPTVIGARNFLGNGIVYPAGGRTGDDCLLATKVMIPVAGPVREGVGLLGSPCFEIPRSVQRDHRFDHLNIARRRRRQLKAKNRHNAATAGLHLLVRWLYLTGIALVALLPLGAGAWFPLRGDLVLRLRGVTLSLHGDLLADALISAASIVIMLALTVGYFALVERAVTRFRRLQPRFCSVYEPPFWRHERFWKVPSIAYIQMFSGTPFKSVVWRLLGVRVGRRVFDDGCSIVERTLVQIGGEATLNAGCILQGHSLEGGAFKSGPIVVGDRCTIGTGAFAHYGVTMGDGAVLEADSFLMKGEHLAPGSRWLGNPAANASVRRAASRQPAAPPRPPAAPPPPVPPPAAARTPQPAEPAPTPAASAPPPLAEAPRLPKRLDPLTAPHWPPDDHPAPPDRTGSPPEPPARARHNADLQPQPDPGR